MADEYRTVKSNRVHYRQPGRSARTGGVFCEPCWLRLLDDSPRLRFGLMPVHFALLASITMRASAIESEIAERTRGLRFFNSVDSARANSGTAVGMCRPLSKSGFVLGPSPSFAPSVWNGGPTSFRPKCSWDRRHGKSHGPYRGDDEGLE